QILKIQKGHAAGLAPARAIDDPGGGDVGSGQGVAGRRAADPQLDAAKAVRGATPDARGGPSLQVDSDGAGQRRVAHVVGAAAAAVERQALQIAVGKGKAAAARQACGSQGVGPGGGVALVEGREGSVAALAVDGQWAQNRTQLPQEGAAGVHEVAAGAGADRC